MTGLLIQAVALAVTLTSYQPIPAQTKPSCKDKHHCETSINDVPTKFGCAASQDLLKSGTVHYGDVLYVPGYGYRIINDAMGETKCEQFINHECVKRVPIIMSIDLMVWSRDEEKAVGVRQIKVYKVGNPE